ncbi:MAG: hypothetical protein EON53_12110 [Actinomycetales bacterium]|nr:MAG: hypothetical protein EON53_12110 [Actinomycetales bacterium]
MTQSARRRWFALLTPAQTTGVMLAGLDVVGGPVVPLEEATYADADAARAAFGHPAPAPGAGRFVDFLVVPELPGVEVRDGVLTETRAPSGTEFWRLEADGRRRVVSYYDTPAYGWRNGRGDVRPAQHVGLRARYAGGGDYVAAFEDGVDGVHLVAVDEDPPEGFAWTKVGVSRRTVPLSDVELYDAATGNPFTSPV